MSSMSVRASRIRCAVLAASLACGLGCGTAVLPPRTRPGTPPKHVLLVTVEGLRADRLSCYQHLVPTSALPASLEERVEGRAFGLDELARGGVLFASAFASSSAAIPSLAALHTGRSPIETGVLDDEGALGEREATLAGVLARAGFATAACIGSARRDTGGRVAAGFERVEQAGSDAAALQAARVFFERDVGDGRSTFLWLHLGDLALPWDAPLEPPSGRRFGTGPGDDAGVGTRGWLAAHAAPGAAWTEADRAALAAAYDLRVRAVVEELAQFLSDTYDWQASPVEATETWERTVFVFAGVSGLDLGERGPARAPGAALAPHEEALRVPLVLRHPDSLTGERVATEIVTLEDVAPTLLDWFGLEAPEAMDGRSLLALLDEHGRRPFEPRPAVAVFPGPIYSLRAEDVRAVWNRWGSEPDPRVAGAPRELALFDRRLDPGERNDVAGEHPRAADWARAEIERWRSQRTAWRAPRGTHRP